MSQPHAPLLLLGPAGAGKTRACLDRIRAVLRETPLAPVWALLPDRHQAVAFRQRLAEEGGALGAHVGTFGDLYAEILALAGTPIPVAPEPVLHHLVQAAIDALADQKRLQHYLPIQRRPGLAPVLRELFAELKRARIEPEVFSEAVRGSESQRLEELAALYAQYQSMLIRFGWADPEGLGWLALKALEEQPALAANWRLVAADGFDSFNPTQLKTLELLAGRIGELRLTLTGEPEMKRAAHRRFRDTLTDLKQALAPTIEALPLHAAPGAPLAHLEANLFTAKPEGQPDSPCVTLLEAQTPALEAREALRWLKARVQRDEVPLNSCAIVAHDLARYQPFLRETAREFGLPVRFAGGEALITNPALAALLNALSLSLVNWARRPLLDALRTPYFNLKPLDLPRTQAAQFDEAARWGLLVEGLDQWQETFERLAAQKVEADEDRADDTETRAPHPPHGPAAQAALDSLRRLTETLTPPATATPKAYVAWVETLLEALAVPAQVSAQPDTAWRDESALEVFRDVLRALVLSDAILGQSREMPYADFYAQLRGAVEAASYTPDPPQAEGQIFIADATVARGVAYRAVALLGLAEGVFPAPLAEDPLLSEEERQSLRDRGLPLELHLRSDQQTLFYEAATRATAFLLLTRPYLAEDGETWEPSPYWTAARELFVTEPLRVRLDQERPLPDAASPVELLTGAVKARKLPRAFKAFEPQWKVLQQAGQVLQARLAPEAAGPYEGQPAELAQMLAARFGPAHVWSASRLEAYRTCRFWFYIGNALGLEPREAPAPGYDVATRGSMLHAILEAVYQAADPNDPDALAAALPGVASTIFATAPEDFGFRPTALWETEQAALVEEVRVTLYNLAEEAGDYHPVQFEAWFDRLKMKTTAGTVTLHGKIDRVDQSDAGAVRVIDYKSGSSHLDKASLVEGQRLQLPIYALGAQEALKLGPVSDGFYWSLSKGEAGSLRLSAFTHHDDDGRDYQGVRGAMELAARYVGEAVSGVRAGEFAPLPPRTGCPEYCPAITICWRYEPGW